MSPPWTRLFGWQELAVPMLGLQFVALPPANTHLMELNVLAGNLDVPNCFSRRLNLAQKLLGIVCVTYALNCPNDFELYRIELGRRCFLGNGEGGRSRPYCRYSSSLSSLPSPLPLLIGSASCS